jgi:BirA family transcriptional regulator, biotin operon repressor / biotin---[acetyl-CoA-carboxylase] ligase
VSPPVHHFARVESTMDVLHLMAADGAVAGTAVVAAEQIQGRGSRAREWHSPLGGLWLSMLYRPPVPGAVEVMSLRAGLAAALAIEDIIGGPLQLKWPNDLLLDGRKVGGVLCEARWQGDSLAWVVIGLGLNVRNKIPEELSGTAAALASSHDRITLSQVSEAVIPALRSLDLRGEQLSRAELEQFSRRDWLRGRIIQQPLPGTVTGLREDGALLVQTPDGIDTPVRTGSVELASHTG